MRRKRRHYNERILNVDNGSFTSLVLSIHGALGREYKTIYSHLTTLIRTNISFALLKLNLLCLRGS